MVQLLKAGSDIGVTSQKKQAPIRHLDGFCFNFLQKLIDRHYPPPKNVIRPLIGIPILVHRYWILSSPE